MRLNPVGVNYPGWFFLFKGKEMNPKLKEFFDSIAHIQNKNAGGCLFFCYVFWLWLKKKGLPTESFQIMQYGYSKNDSSLIRNIEWTRGNNNRPGSGAHFTWLYQGTEYDGTGVINTDRWAHYYRRRLPYLNTKRIKKVEEFCQNALSNGSWNRRFNRAKAKLWIKWKLGIEVPV